MESAILQRWRDGPGINAKLSPVSVRLERQLIARLDAVIAYGSRNGHTVSRSELIREALDAYLQVFEQEFGAALDAP